MTLAPIPLQILLVEDSVPDSLLVREALHDIEVLEALNIEVSTAATLDEALSTVLACRPDCILLDLSLPNAEGTGAVRALHAAAPRTPIIVITSLDDELTGLEAIAAGARDYLVSGQVAGEGLGRIIRYAIERERISQSASSATAASESMLTRRRRAIGASAIGVAVLSLFALALAISRADHGVTALEASFAVVLSGLAVGVTLYWALAAGRHRGRDEETEPAAFSIRLPERTIETWNQGAARLYGYSAEEVIGRDLGMLVPDRLRDEPERELAALREGKVVEVETQRLHRDGRTIPVSLTLTPSIDKHGHLTGVSGLILPASGASRALGRAEGRFRSAFKQAPAGMAIVAVDPASYGRLLQVNPALCDLAGLSEPDLLRKNVMTLLESDPSDSDAMAALLAGRLDSHHVERRLRRGDDRSIWVRVSASVVRDDAGKPLYGLGQVHDITERKHAQEAQAHLAAIVDSSKDAIIATDSSRRITAWNGGATTLFGHSMGAVIGHDFSMLVPAELRSQERAFMDRAIAGQASEAHDTLMRSLDGSVIEVSLRTSPVLGDDGAAIGASAIARDITTETAGATALHVSEKRLRQIVETANEGIWTLDEQWRTTFVNQKMAEILGTTVEAMFGTSVFDYYAEADRAEAQRLLSERGDGARDQFEIRLMRADGREVWVLMSASGLFDGNGALTGALAMVADITEHRAAERELEQWQRLEGLGQLAGGVAHDMNNLLGVILNFSDFGLESVGEGPGSEELAEIHQAAERAATLTRQLLVFARHDAVRHESFDLNALLDDIEKLLRRTIGENIALSCHHDAPLPAVNANSGLVEQVVLNLVVNARDAMPDGGQVTITTGLLTVAVDEPGLFGDMAAGDYVCLDVEDTGEGMTKAVAARAFEPFFTTKPAGSGTGLGLATVYGAVTKAGGRVKLYSEPGHGTQVKVWLPVAHDPDPPPAVEAEPPPAPAAQGTVLVVEDDSGVRKVTVRILQQHGYEVIAAAGPAEGLALARNHRNEICLVITDVVMPDMSGPEMAQRLGRTHPGIPIIFVSGYTDRPDALPHDALFLSKPFTRLELLQQTANAWPTPVTAIAR